MRASAPPSAAEYGLGQMRTTGSAVPAAMTPPQKGVFHAPRVMSAAARAASRFAWGTRSSAKTTSPWPRSAAAITTLSIHRPPRSTPLTKPTMRSEALPATTAAQRERRDQERAGGERFREEIRRDPPPPRPRRVRHVVDGTGERAVPRVGLDRGDHPHEVELPLGALRPEVALRRRLELGREGRGVGAEVEDLGPRALVGLAHLHGGARDEPGDPRLGIVEVAGDDRLLGADDHARGLEPHLDAMGAVVALRGGPRVRIDVERVVGTRLHARLAADAAIAVQVDDAVGSAIERDRRADRHARCRVAVVAAEP